MVHVVDGMSEASACILKRSRVSIHRFDIVGIGVGVGHCVGIGVGIGIAFCIIVGDWIAFLLALALDNCTDCIVHRASPFGIPSQYGFRVGVGLSWLDCLSLSTSGEIQLL